MFQSEILVTGRVSWFLIIFWYVFLLDQSQKTKLYLFFIGSKPKNKENQSYWNSIQNVNWKQLFSEKELLRIL